MNNIEIYDNVISREGCNKIIEYFDGSPKKSFALTVDGIVKKDKNGMDIGVYFSHCEETMYHLILEYIKPALDQGLERYKKKYPFIDRGIAKWILEDGFNIQKFDGKEEGYFATHCEAGGPSLSRRVLVWMIYLNNANCGTRFYYPTRDVKAKAGRLVLWPAGWTHPHSGITPNKGEKYLMTGWYSFE